jgi:hypothetical protein
MSLEDDLRDRDEDYVEGLETRELRFVVDEDDYEWIMRAIASRQAVRVGGKPLLAAGKGDLGGRYLASVCRTYLEYVEVIEAEDAGEEGGE